MPAAAPVRVPRGQESGYAVLMIFLVAAVLALTLYQAMPRVAFELERDKEQLLIDRGEQYKRAIQLYYRKFQKYPVKMEDLESTNNLRFLRKRYVDPMTGKSEWRLIHVGPNGVFTDSLTQKTTNKDTKAASVNNFITELGPIGDVPTGTSDAVNPGLRRRPSDQAAGSGGDPNSAFPNQPGSDPSAPPMGDAGMMTPGQPNNSPPAPIDSDEPGSGLPSNASAANNFTSNGGVPNNPGALTGGALPGGASGTQPNGSNGAALIQQMLTSPRPGGPPQGIFNQTNGDPQNGSNSTFQNVQTTVPPGQNGSTGTMGGGANGGSSTGQFLAGSFAGVASTAEAPGIKIYNDHKKYNEWEFIYDYAKDLAKAAGLPVNNAGANSQNSTGQNSNNSNGNSPSTSTNSTSSTGTTGASGSMSAGPSTTSP